MIHCKLHIGCLVVVLYVAFIYIRGCKRYKRKMFDSPFGALVLLSIASLCFDGITAYTVNHLDVVDPVANLVFHALFLSFLDAVIFAFFLYTMYITGAFPKKKLLRIMIFLPVIVSMAVVILNIGSLEYIQGEMSNYSMGVSAYTCFIMVAVYIGLSIFFCARGFRNFRSEKRDGIITYMAVSILVAAVQMVFPETLISCIAVTIMLLGVYMNFEDNALKELSNYYRETVVSFADLVEKRDKNTGGHVVRTAKYVELIVDELKRRGIYTNVLTKDYVDNLLNAAPMHDIGKISIPDAVLQKPGKLTDEEYAIMKTHSEVGGRIIQESFKNLSNAEYCKMAYEVARFHHEKWNGKGYPDMLSGEQIPLCARIMAVADVFDAVSAKRCYRDALPLDTCFKIIEDGSGKDFDPQIAKAFLAIRPQIEEVCRELTVEEDEQSLL